MIKASSSYRVDPYRSKTASRPKESAVGQPGDRVTLSAAAETHNWKNMGLLGGVGLAVGIAATALLCPAAGLGALAFGGLMGGVTGAAIGDGALKDAGTRPAKDFDPYNINDVLDPENLYHPRNPFNPANPIFDKH